MFNRASPALRDNILQFYSDLSVPIETKKDVVRWQGVLTSLDQLKLFTPAPAFRVRFNNNHDTPLAPETPLGENPPEGAVIDYWLANAPRGPVRLDIRDASGTVVRRFASTDRPVDLSADRYFAAVWVKPDPVLAATPGAHRWIWDLRLPRPKAVSYNYSIAAVPGQNTPLDPRGQLVEPGRYTAVLTVDGRIFTAPLDVLPDPRVTGADYHAAMTYSQSLYEPTEKSWRGYAETKAVRDQLAKRIGEIHDPALLAEAKALDARLEPPKAPNAGFEGESGTLAALETSAEASDIAPAAGLREIAAQTVAEVNADWAAWQLARLEVSRQEGVILHLGRGDAVARQRLHCRVARTAEGDPERDARDHQSRRETELP